MRTAVAAHSVLRIGCAFLVVALVAGGSAAASPLARKKLYDLPYPMPEAFHNIRGQDAAIRELLIFGETVVRPETFARAGIRSAPAHRTALLYGPPGTGKTSLVHALVEHLNADERPGARRVLMRSVDVNALLSPYIGETEERIRDEFLKAASKVQKKGVIVFVYLDEIDKLAQKRDSGGPDGRGPSPALHQLLTIIGSVEWPQDVVPIASTNTVSDLDAAIMRRFGWPIALPHPTKRGRHAILDHYTDLMNLRAFGVGARADRERLLERANRWLFLRRVARKTFYMSPADLERIVRMAGIMAADRRGLRHLPPPADPAAQRVTVAVEEPDADGQPAAEEATTPVTMRDFKDAISKFWLLKESESVPIPRPRRPLFEKNPALRVLRQPAGVRAGVGELIKDHRRKRLGVPDPARMRAAPDAEQTRKQAAEDRRIRAERRGRWLGAIYREGPLATANRRGAGERDTAHQRARTRAGRAR